jgi:hypothetical protein
MKSDTIKSILFLMVILIGGLALAPYLASVEGYENKSQVSLLPGIYPDTVDKPILDSFPLTGKTSALSNTDKSNSDTTIFGLGSYAQITNNMKYVQNPDNGSCTPAMFCNLLYKNIDLKKEHETNVITALKPATEGAGARVNYYRSSPNTLFFSIPTNENILY